MQNKFIIIWNSIYRIITHNHSYFRGTVQLGYTGASPRGDTTNDNFFDTYAGTYPLSPVMTYCADNATGIGYINIDWNKQGAGDLLMVGLPHHVRTNC